MKKIKIKSIQPIQISPKIKNFIQNINYLINNYVPEINEFPEKKLIRELVKCQEKINQKFGNKVIYKERKFNLEKQCPKSLILNQKKY